MSHRYILHRRQNRILYAEFLLVAAVTAVGASFYMALHPMVGWLIGVVFALLIAYVFFRSRIFRYGFSILFSIAWGVGMYLFGGEIDCASTTSLVLGLAGFFI